MELSNRVAWKNCISWGSIIAGVFTVMAISLLLSILGTSFGMSMLSPESDDIVNGADTTILIWSLISILISLACGAFITGRLANTEGAIHGFLVWATTLIMATVLGFSVLSNIISMTGTAVSSVVSATGGMINATARGGAKGVLELGKGVFEQLHIDSHLPVQNSNQQVTSALAHSNIDALQPDYLQRQLDGAEKDTSQAMKRMVITPDKTNEIISALLKKLKKRSETISNSINRNDVKKALAANSSLTPQEADKAVDNLMQTREKMSRLANQRLEQLENDIDDARQHYAALKQEAKEKANAATKAVARLSLWSSIGLLFGAIISTLSGLWGVNTAPVDRRNNLN